MNVVVVDGGYIGKDVMFPQLNLKKFGWIQYPFSEDAEVAERCWRSSVIISVKTKIDKSVIDKAVKLQLIVAAGGSYDHIDLNAAKARGIIVCNTPGLAPSDSEQIKKLCRQVVTNINSFLKGDYINQVGG